MSYRLNYGLFFVLGASLLLSFAFCPPFDLIGNDKEFFKYTGMAILKGQVPYRDFFDHKTPVIYFINAAGAFLGPWGLWLINTVCAGVITWLFYRLCLQYRLTYPWLLPLLFNLMIRNNLVSSGMHLTREYSTFFVMLFFCVMMGKYRYSYFLLGLLTALTFFTQQDQVLLLIPLLLYVFLEGKTDTPFIRFSRLSAGFLSITALIFLYFAYNRSLGCFWQDAFQFNFSYYIREKKSLWDHFRTIKRVLDNINFEVPFMTALVLGISSLFLQNKKKPLVIAAILALLLSMSSELLGGRYEGLALPMDFGFYFLPLSATVCILLFMVFAFAGNRILTDGNAQLPYALLLCAGLTYSDLQHFTNLRRRKDQPQANRAELLFLRHQKLTDYQLYIMLDEAYAYYYNELKILSPSPWLYQQFWLWYSNWDKDQRLIQGIGRDLLRHNTTYVLSDPKIVDEMRIPSNRDWWMAFLREYYEPVIVPGNQYTILWKRKGSPPSINDP